MWDFDLVVGLGKCLLFLRKLVGDVDSHGDESQVMSWGGRVQNSKGSLSLNRVDCFK